MEAGQEVDPILSSYLKDNTQKRKSKRRSSVSSHEAMKMMKLATQHEDMDEDAILNKIADIQFEFLENQYNKFKEHEKKAKKLAQTSTAALKLSNSKTDDEKKLSFQEQYDRDYALLDDRQKKFLEDSDIKNEMFLNVIKYKRRKAMKELCDNINDTTMDKEPRNSFLTKKQSRLSLVSSTAIQIKNNSKRGIPEILEEYFEC